jgi:glycosyltransferase involved in cell wall biosynthesis
VLEWNGDVIWTREHWETTLGMEKLFDRHLVKIQRWNVDSADLIVAVSEHAAEMAIRAGASATRVVVVPNGVDTGRVHPGEVGDTSREGVLIGWVGSYGPWHGADILIEAVPLLPSSVRVLMVGDGDERSACEARARALGVWDRITWAGRRPHSEAIALLGECDVLVSPHVPLPDQAFFGSPTKIFEYMALGRPIVASRLGQIGTVLEHGRTGYLVEPGDPQDLAAGLMTVLRTPDRGRSLGEAARAEAETRHTWSQRAQAILGHLAEVGS